MCFVLGQRGACERETTKLLDEDSRVFEEGSDAVGFVAFCDILGFSARVRKAFDETARLYSTFTKLMIDLNIQDVQVSVFSDSIIIISYDFFRIVDAVNVLWFAVQTHFFIMRGGIAQGRIWTRTQDHNLILVSEALVRAVELEKTVGVPVIQIAPELEIPLGAWVPRFQEGPTLARLLYHRGLNFVSPFGRYWFASAAPRFEQMKEAADLHNSAKYDWLLDLHRAVRSDEDLVPPNVIEKFIELGIIRLNDPTC